MSAPVRLMFLGADTLAGQAFRARWDRRSNGSLAKTAAWESGFFDSASFDMTSPSELRDAVQRFAPSLILCAAEMADMEEAERAPERAQARNFDAVAGLAAQASARDVPLVLLSTDQVFDGAATAPCRPETPMNPLNQYGLSKLLGEEAVRHELAWHVILRTGPLFASAGDALLAPTLASLESGSALSAEDSARIFSPTPAEALAEALLSLAEQLMNGMAEGFGTFHFAGAPAVSGADWREEVRRRAGLPEPTAPPAESPETSPSPLRKPRHVALDTARLERVYGIAAPDWKTALDRALAARQRRTQESS